jgi:hypothetical protein
LYSNTKWGFDKERSHSAEEVKTKKLIKIDKFSKHVYNLTNAELYTKLDSLNRLDELKIYPKNAQEANAFIRALT